MPDNSILLTLDAHLCALHPHLDEMDLSVLSELSPSKWCNSRIKEGVNQDSLYRIVSKTFGIRSIDVKECKNGYFIGDGFYDSSQQVLFTNRIHENHFNPESKIGVILGETVDIPESNSMLSDVCLSLFKKKLTDEYSGRGKTDFVFRKKAAFAHYGCRDVFAELLPNDILANSSKYHELNSPDLDSAFELWEDPINQLCELLNDGCTQKLMVLSGDDVIALKFHIINSINRNTKLYASNCENFDVMVIDENDTSNSEMLHNASDLLSTGKGFVVFISSAKSMIDLFPQLLSLFTVKQIVMQFASHHIRVKMPKLCDKCSRLGPLVTPKNITIEFSLDARRYKEKGDGCNYCIDGFSGVHVLKEDSVRDHNIAKSILESRCNEDPRVEPYVIFKELNKSEVASVYKSLGFALSHGLVQVEDAKSVLL